MFKNIQIQGKLPHYSHLMYDKYRKVFYRFALMPDDNIKPFSNNPHQSFSIIILNKDYEIIGETKFPGNTYAHHLCFVGKKGLYISENNENNPQFDENKLVFRCFTLQDRKKWRKRTTQSFYVEGCSWQAVCPIMTNAFKNCLMKSELR